MTQRSRRIRCYSMKSKNNTHENNVNAPLSQPWKESTGCWGEYSVTAERNYC